MRVVAGPEKKTRVMGEKERLITAYHEMGHAIVGHFLEHSDPVHKISIISRGQALGYTISLPTEDKFLTTRAELLDTMAMTLGGRAAEEIVFGEITTGASNDLEKVTATAKQMVMRFGMSEKLGPRVFGHDHGQPFLGREFSSEPDYSRRDRARDRRRDPPHRRGRAPGGQGHPGRAPRAAWRRSPSSCSSARRSSARSSRRCSTARPRSRSGARAEELPPGTPGASGAARHGHARPRAGQARHPASRPRRRRRRAARAATCPRSRTG